MSIITGFFILVFSVGVICIVIDMVKNKDPKGVTSSIDI